jgi:hypothetical protein
MMLVADAPHRVAPTRGEDFEEAETSEDFETPMIDPNQNREAT